MLITRTRGPTAPIGKMRLIPTGQGAQPASFEPSNIVGLIGWFDVSAANTLSLSGADVTTMAAPLGGQVAVAGPHGGPKYVASEPRAGGRPALVWPNDLNDKGLEIGADAPCSEIFVVKCYKDRLAATFDNYVTLLADHAGITGQGKRSVGEQDRARIWSNGPPRKAHINGSGPLSNILPLPLSVVRYSSQDHDTPGTPISIATIGGPNKGSEGRSWQGIMCEVLAFSAAVTLTPDEIAQVETYLMNKWGIA